MIKSMKYSIMVFAKVWFLCDGYLWRYAAAMVPNTYSILCTSYDVVLHKAATTQTCQ